MTFVNTRIAQRIEHTPISNEMWGLGLPKVFAKIVAAGLPSPEIIDWGNAIRIIVRRWPASQKSSQKSSQKTSQKSSQKSGDLQERVFALMKGDPKIGTQQIAEELKVTRRTVAKQVLGLKKAGLIRRVGPDKGGHWEVL